MKLTGELRDKVKAVETKEEMKDIIAEAGMELTDDEIEEVSGGIRRSDGKLAQPDLKLAQPDLKLPQPNGRLPR